MIDGLVRGLNGLGRVHVNGGMNFFTGSRQGLHAMFHRSIDGLARGLERVHFTGSRQPL